MQTNKSACDDTQFVATATGPTKPADAQEIKAQPAEEFATVATARVDSATEPTADVPLVTLVPASTSAPAYRFERDDKPMLSQKGNYPDRHTEPLNYWARVKRAEQPASPWLADWENSLSRAGWVVVRKLTDGETDDLPWEEMDPAFPQDADLYCPKRRIYISFLPSYMPEGADFAFRAIRAGYPGSLLIIHARNVLKHQFGPLVQDGAVGLLTPENTKRCRELNGLVEFQGVLYEVDPENDWWTATKSEIAADIYREYRLHSLYYHEEEQRRERARKQAEKESETISEIIRKIISEKAARM